MKGEGDEVTYEVVVGPGDTRAIGIRTLTKAVKLAKGWAANAALGGDAKVLRVRGELREEVDKYGLHKGRVRRIKLAASRGA